MNSIYDLDPHIQKLLSLDNFLDNLTVYEFIEELSKDHSLKSTEVNQLKYLDPKPFIRTFESTLNQLNKLNQEAAQKQAVLSQEVSKFELDHSRNVLSLTSRTESIQSQFKQLDDQISQVNSSITPFTESLTKTINTKERSIATISLVRIYNDFYSMGKSPELSSLMNGSTRDKIKCASISSQLIPLSSKLISNDLENSIHCHDVIIKFSETMEQTLLKDFNQFYKDNNIPQMKEIADILIDYNDGMTVIKNFINQHLFFLNTEDEENDDLMENQKIWENLSNPFIHQNAVIDEFISSHFDKYSKIIQDETQVILKVFKNPIPVLQLFIQRIFAQQIQSKIETFLKNSYSLNNLAYLRILNSLFTIMSSINKDLKDFFHDTIPGEHKIDELNLVLDQSFSDLFTSHLIDLKYFELEKKNLESIFATITSKYEHLNEHKISNKLNAKLQGSTHEVQGENEYENLNRRSKVGQFKNFMKSQLERSQSLNGRTSEDNLPQQQQQDDDAELNLKNVDDLLKSTVESLSRIIELTPTKISEYSLEILEILLIGLGKSYLDISLDITFTELHQQDFKPDLINFQYLSNIKTSSEILYLVSTCIRTIILPLSNNSPTLKTKMINLTNSYISRCEQSINLILKDTLTLCQDKIQNALSKQKKKDFLPKIGELVDTDTLPCELITNFLTDLYQQFQTHLNGDNLNTLLFQLGDFLFLELFQHFKNFQINSTGGIVITKDIISYQTTIESWGILELTKKFQLLRELANLFTVQPELIQSLTKEGQLASVKPYVLRQFIMKRWDYSSSYVDKLKGFM
ncbi:Exocyst complex component [Wickerhamomyces ciferrii]|uniref:Exocyst complex component n=1 Tax=Wickerhamomyces ciferrii (strain ATCC 14091 / BCRC 22168 / CBS 111 / JCM 3599 / NBRC 0793 / NRRL Y-1031 F-60-10) TaxID=1206466 RepID=K0KJZ1_WICCF|nr:Exocyst complex component [Wickerhamomyces ciferrii]CCH43251.1 Exocyst complex component [Wickerhamomyces ciferrii]